MRRFTAVFASRRSDKSDVSSSYTYPSAAPPSKESRKKSTGGAHTNDRPAISPAASVSPLTPQLTASDPAKSSGSSSSGGSTGLRTPDDDATWSRSFSGKKHWISWLARKKSSNALQSSHQEWDDANTTWHPHPAPILHPAPLGRQQRPVLDTEEETSSDSDAESEPYSHLEHPSIAVNSSKTVTHTHSREYAAAITSNKLGPPPFTPPLLHLPGSHLFPRSCNVSRFMPFPETLESTLQRRKLLKRLDGALSQADEASIIAFSARPTPPKHDPQPLSDHNIIAPEPHRVSSFSPGLKRWTTRKPFEERMLVWLPSDDGMNSSINATHVKGTAFGVPEVEFSESLEILAGTILILDRPRESEPLPELESPTQPSSSNSSRLSVANDARKTPYKALPSPLRMQHGPVSPQVSPASSSGAATAADQSSTDAGPASHDSANPPEPPSVKRGVRFAEDDKDNTIPLGYVLRMKQRREQKAKFLQAEKERREFEAEKRRVETERRQREAERQEWEKERKIWEREKKAMEEERKQRLYAEEVAAARTRRESQRAGHHVPSSSSLNVPSPRADPDHSDTRRYQRPVYDTMTMPRRHTSEPAPWAGFTPSNAGSSTGSSRAPSINTFTPSSGGSLRNSRPPSMYSAHSSMEDLRLRDGSANSTSRSSFASLPRTAPDRAISYPARAVGAIPPVPPVPGVPMFVMEVPLLPPNPPFMLQQYPRRRSSPNSSPSSSRRSSDIPSNNSSERANQPSPRASSKPSPPQPRHFSPSPTFQRRPVSDGNHHRRSMSGDDALLHRGNMEASNSRPASQSASPSSLRGKPPAPASSSSSSAHLLAPPNPWMPPRSLSSPTPATARMSVAGKRPTVIS